MMRGFSPQGQNIPVVAAEARRLRWVAKLPHPRSKDREQARSYKCAPPVAVDELCEATSGVVADEARTLRWVAKLPPPKIKRSRESSLLQIYVKHRVKKRPPEGGLQKLENEVLLKLPQPDACTRSVQCWRLQRSRLPMHRSVQSACEAAGCSVHGQT